MRLKNRDECTEIIETIEEIYGGVIIELDYTTPFQLLMAVILSAQTTDKQVNRITPALFARVREPADMRSISLEEVTELVQRVNYFRNKAKYLYTTGLLLAEKYESTIPNDLIEIQKLP